MTATDREEYIALLNEYAGTILTCKAFCSLKGVNVRTVRRWARRLGFDVRKKAWIDGEPKPPAPKVERYRLSKADGERLLLRKPEDIKLYESAMTKALADRHSELTEAEFNIMLRAGGRATVLCIQEEKEQRGF